MSRAIKRIIADYSAGEEAEAKKQHREAVWCKTRIGGLV